MKREAVITGTGCISPLGNSPQDFYQNIKQSLEQGIFQAPPQQYSDNDRLKDFQFDDQELLQKYPRLDISCQYILHAVKQAAEQAGLTPEVLNNDRVVIIIGSTFGLMNSQEKFLQMLYRTGKGSPMFFQQTANNLLSGIIAYKYHVDGLNMTLYNGWTAGLDAVILGRQLINSDQADIVIAGGVDILNETIIAQFKYTNRKKRFIKNLTPGEGAGVLVLESLDNALKRNRKKLGVLLNGNQVSFFRYLDFKRKCKDIFANIADMNFLTNLNPIILPDVLKKDDFESKNVRLIQLQETTGICGAAFGVLQIIYALHCRGVNMIFNAGMDQISYINVESND